MSEELQEQAEQQAAGEPSSPPAVVQEQRADMPAWAGAIRYAGLAVAVAALFAGLSVVLPFVGSFTFLWMIASPVVVLGLFHGKYPMARITAGFGARVGLVTGLGISVVMLAGNAITLLMMRRTHAPDYVAEMVAQLKQQPNALQDPGVMQFIEKVNTTPEYRAGLVLLALGMMVGLLLLATTAAGAFAGFARSRQRG